MRKQDAIQIRLEYPRSRPIKYINIDLIDVRASDGIRISYDFDRDGWVIEQPTVLSWDGDDKICDPKWREAAFIQSWQFFPDEEYK